ncbi:MAG: hypothetical protein IJK71_10740 [Clostridia bacterium]|nr:hypothetical protein [Clostridia bacterium]
MKEQKNWAYGVSINGVGTIFYGREYFDREGIVNPLTTAPYTKEEITAIEKGADGNAEGYVFDLPEDAVLGMNGFWYDADNATAITSHADPLAQGTDGVFTTAGGQEVALPIAK